MILTKETIPLVVDYVKTVKQIQTAIKYGYVDMLKILDERRKKIHDNILDKMGKSRDDSDFSFELMSFVYDLVDN